MSNDVTDYIPRLDICHQRLAFRQLLIDSMLRSGRASQASADEQYSGVYGAGAANFLEANTSLDHLPPFARIFAHF